MTDPYLTGIPQWLPVLLAPKGNGKTDKLPCNLDGVPCDAHDPRFWTSHDQALATAQRLGPNYTVGLVLTTNDDLFCVDIDGALQDDGQWSPLAQQLAASLPGCFIEVSQSGKGLHIWGRYPSPPAHRKKRIDLGIECYSEARFIAVGTPLTGAIAERCDAFPAVLAHWFAPPTVNAQAVPNDGPRADWRGPTDDTELLRRAMQSRSAAAMFGGGKATFADLFLADADALGKAYPADQNSTEPFDRSSADAALASHLAFWTGCDVGRIERLMRQSKLAREKWDDRSDYLVARTITNACSVQRDVLVDKPIQAPPADPPAAPPAPAATVPAPPGVQAPPAPAQTAASGMRVVEGSTFLTPAQQTELFAGCVYVLEPHRVLVAGGRLLKPDQFKAYYGGYTFVMDGRNEKVSKNAFEAFTESQALRATRVDNTCFKPLLPYGSIVKHGLRSLVNTFVPPDIVRTPGDATPFLNHLAKLVPDEYERKVVFYLMCALVQYAGRKAQWCMVMQGVEGNGKTLLARFLAYAIGKEYTYWARPDKLVKDFNAYLVGKLLILGEEIMVGDRQDFIDVLKPLITSVDGIEIEKKGIDQVNAEICCNFWFTTNHKNAIRKTRNDRRFFCLQTAQQTVDDLARDGITGEYMHELHTWANNGGFAIVAHVLATTPIPAEFDFTKGMQRAPITRSTQLAIDASLGVVEQEVLDAVEREEPGFRGGWISSGYLDKLLVRLGKDRAVPINKRKELLEALGYVWQRRLEQGRVNNTVLPDGAKVKLFARADRADLHALAPAEAATAYSKAQAALGS